MGVSYRVLGLPAKGTGAFTPLPARNPVASSYGLVQISGSPGTMAVPVNPPRYIGNLTSQPAPDTAQGMDVSPDVILPAIYIPWADNMGPAADTGLGMTRRRFNELPIRAGDPGRLPVPVAMQFPAGGRQLPWPRAFIRWPSRTGPDSGSPMRPL